MSASETKITRRDLIEGAAYATLSLALGFTIGESEGAQAELFNAKNPLSRVVLVRDQSAIGADGSVNADVVARMLDRAVSELSGEKDPAKAWKRYFRPNDTVGVKMTRCQWMRVHTHDEVVNAILRRIEDCGVKKERIHTRDYGLPVEACTALVNVPTIKVHTLTGIAVSIKNYINFTGKESSYHFEGSAKLGEAWLLPQVKGKTRLIVVDALRPYFGPGPQINPLHQWDYKALIVGTDPVAIDTVCLALCQRKRNLFKGEEWPITPPPKSIAAADTEYHLGTSDPRKIKLVKLGWQKDVLI